MAGRRAARPFRTLTVPRISTLGVGKNRYMREMPILVPHTDYGDQECCGIIMPVESGDQADLVCNECGAVISSVEPTLLRMAMSGGLCSETCPHCGQLNTFPGFSSMEAYTCRHCDLGVIVRKPVQWRF